MAFRDVSKNLGGNLTNRYLSRYPHYSCLGPNLHSIQLFGEVDDLDPRLISGESIPFKYSLPAPLLRMKEAPKSCEFFFGKDPGLDIVHQKARWKENIQRELALVLARKRYKDVPMIEKELQRKKKMKRLPSHVVLLSKLLEYDPCSEFDGVYNWYYSGGCLCHVAFNGQDFLLRPGGNHFDRLDAIPLSKGENVYFDPKLENTTKFYMGNKSPIYQIIANQEHGLVGIRQRRKCKILSTMESDEILRFCTVDNCKSSTATFTSIDLDGANEGNYATMDTASNVHIRSVDCSASFISKWSVPGCSDDGFDKWCCAQFGQNKDSVICINRQVIRTYDIRVCMCVLSSLLSL
ncbi:uncharacterized protein LOC124166698 isoform X1 [Ischnura elegans]|uniref:uncharacterized protein LOC124166698 isoform X1 n=1 Tax=Ischnura elegans TaxID=197161 RepID=UPI001ED8A335|nr:uncharacterized protein LOC124166698 isoform X1 [Ischnura elegans]